MKSFTIVSKDLFMQKSRASYCQVDIKPKSSNPKTKGNHERVQLTKTSCDYKSRECKRSRTFRSSLV